MGVRFPSVFSTTIVNAAVVTTAQTIICQTPPLNISLDFALVILLWWITLTVGAGATAVQYFLRRGLTLTSPAVNVNATTSVVTAATQSENGGVYVDVPGAVAGQQYTLSVAFAAATGNSTINDVCMVAFAL